MSLVETVLSRRSIRQFEHKDIPKEVLEKILEAGRMAPSAGNKQSWHFIVIKDDELCEEYIIPSVFDKRVAKAVAHDVARAAQKTKIARRSKKSLRQLNPAR